MPRSNTPDRRPLHSPGDAAASRYDVVIVGSGFSGIGMGIKLLEAGIDSFVILERADDIGGTWRDNDYPGCACDIPSHLYSFSFETSAAWSRMFPEQAEILRYLKDCVAKYALTRHIRFGQNVVDATFDDKELQWLVHTATGDEYLGRTLVSGMGGLSRPAIPALEGHEKFRGRSFHSANWDHDYDLQDRAVAVIGTGASAVQFVPQIIDRVKSMALFQRTPPWIVPKLDRPIGERERWLYRNVPLTRRLFRHFIYWRQEVRGIGFTIDSRLMVRARKIALEHLHEQVASETLRKQLTPDYTIGCKRILISNDYYPALQKSNLSLVTNGIDHINANGIVDGDGRQHDVDAIIYGTGFHATDPLTPTRIFGLGGRDLAAAWADGPEAFLGINVSGFPNLFLLMGPNTGLGHNSMIFMIESQIRYTVKMLGDLLACRTSALDVRPDEQRKYNDVLQRRLARTVWSSGCRSWYQTAAGRHPVLWPGFTFSYWWRTLRPAMRKYLSIQAPNVMPDNDTSGIAG